MAKVSLEQKDVELQQFIGRHVDDPEVQWFIRQIEEEPEAFNLTLEGPDKEVIRLVELGLQVSLDPEKRLTPFLFLLMGSRVIRGIHMHYPTVCLLI